MSIQECHISATLQPLVESFYYGNCIKTLFSPLGIIDYKATEEERISSAQHIIDALHKLFNKLQPTESCPHLDLERPSPTVKATQFTDCPAAHLWRRNSRLQPSKNGDALVKAVDAKPSLFSDVLEIQGLSDQDKLINISLRLIPLVFHHVPDVDVDRNLKINPSWQVRVDFKRPFYGQAVDSLITYTNECYKFASKNNDKIYAKTFPILQSSGTGKTKLAVQLSAQRPGFLVCLRDPTQKKGSGTVSFPPNDQSAYDYFSCLLDNDNVAVFGTDAAETSDEFKNLQRHERIAAWLGAYLKVLADEIQSRMNRSGCFATKNRAKAHREEHKSLEDCWNSLVYSLALDIHNGPDFITDYSFKKGDLLRISLCDKSSLTPTASSAAKLAGQVFDVASSPSTGRPATSPYRTSLLNKIDEIARSHFDPHKNAPKDATQETTTCDSTEHETEHQTGITNNMANASAKDQDPVRYAQYASAKYIFNDLRRLETLLPKPLKQKHYFFLCLDEVAGFQALLPIFRRLWRESNPQCTWLYFVDTDSNIAHLAGQEAGKASLRLDDADTGHLLLPPFIYLPFDVAFVPKKNDYKQRLLDGRLTHDHLVDLIRLFGRPLWSTGLYSDLWKPDLSPSLYRPNLGNILLKLLPERINDSEKWPEPDAYNHHACVFSLLGQRLPLLFVGHQNTRISTSVPERQPNANRNRSETSRSTQQDLVSHHLRIVSELYNTDFFRTSSPSEPALALAAASLFRGDSADAVEKCIERWSTAIRVLADTHRSAGIMLGEEGEECVRLLCNLAADLVAAAAVESTLQQSTQDTLFSKQLDIFVAQSKYICLKDWLECLVGPKSLRQDLCSWSAEYYINFTHWMRLRGTLQPGHLDPMLLAEHWMRQAAFYGQLGQPQWGLVIPIYHSPGHAPRGEEPINPNRFSYVALQVKNRNGEGQVTKFFGPCHWLCTSSIDDQTTPSSQMTTQATCLEIFLDLRAPAEVTYEDLGIKEGNVRTLPRTIKPLPPPSTRSAKMPSTAADQTDDEIVSDEPPAGSGSVDDMDLDDSAEISQAMPLASDAVRPDRAHHLLVRGSNASVFPLLKRLTKDARDDLWNLFGFDEYSNETRLRTLYAAVKRDPLIMATHRIQYIDGPSYLAELQPTVHRVFAHKKRSAGQG
ncbi:uncharacterized protein UTRI_03354 [Ustilago trichophora]|uniref:Uncharacterized protein n=1 Tax=Ustilago trichophora TaxID=86804 RepID=A0A5C3E9V5_9BASI|nr:uncharacterized protein UTRI_03354 [Ustilago trichophora]